MALNLMGTVEGRPENAISVLRDDKFSELTVVLDGDASYDGSYAYPKVIRAGALLGRNTTSGLYAPVKVTTVATSASSINTFVVANAAFFQVGDVISIGATTARTITAIVYSTNSITVSGATFNVTAPTDVVKHTNGTEKAIAIAIETVECRDPENRNNAHKQIRVAVDGFVRSNQVKGDYAAAVALSGNSLSNFIFDTNYGY
jgi:hypothetical protein